MVRRSSVGDLVYVQPCTQRDEELILFTMRADGVLMNMFPAGAKHAVGWNPPGLVRGIK